MVFQYPAFVHASLNAEEWEAVAPEDPVRTFLPNAFPHFCQALSSFSPEILPYYMLFFKAFHKKVGVCHFMSWTEYSERKHSSYEPIPPFFVYRKRQDYRRIVEEHFLPQHTEWIVSWIQKKDVPIHFTAGSSARTVFVSSIMYDSLVVHKEMDTVPLLVIGTEEASLHFAEVVCDLLHCLDTSSALEVIRREEEFIKQGLSVTEFRKLYDCFPEEFINVPTYVWALFQQLDVPSCYHEKKVNVKEYDMDRKR